MTTTAYRLAAARRLFVMRVIAAAVALMTLSGCTAEPDRARSSTSPIPSPITAAYHLDCSAPDGGDGSLEHPWNAADDVNDHGTFRPAERILLRRGTICAGRIAPEGSGTNGHPILLGAYGAGARPVLNGGGTDDRTGTVELRDVHDWVVQDLSVTNRAPGGVDETLRAGILVVNTDGGRLDRIVVRRNLVTNVTSSPVPASADPHAYGGIAIVVRGDGEDGTYDNVLIEDNRVAAVGRSGIVTWSDLWRTGQMTHIAVLGNTLDDVEGDSILMMGVDGGEIDGNVSRNGGHLPDCPACDPSTSVNTASAGIWPTRSQHIGIRHNEVSGEGAAGGDGQGLDIDEYTSDVVVEFNYTHDNDGGGILICGARRADVRYNVLQHDAGAAISFACGQQFERIRIFNNDLLPAPGADVVRTGQASGEAPLLFANNVVVNEVAGEYCWPMPLQASNNTFVGEHPSSEPDDPRPGDVAGLVATGSGSAGIESSSGYALLPQSPSAGTGLPIVDGGVTDYFGNPIDPAAPPRGAAGPSVGTGSPPAVPAPAVRRTGGGLVVTWAARAPFAVYILQRRSAGTTAWRTVAAGLNTTSFEDVGLVGGDHSYRVIAETGGRRSRPSEPGRSLGPVRTAGTDP